MAAVPKNGDSVKVRDIIVWVALPIILAAGGFMFNKVLDLAERMTALEAGNHDGEVNRRLTALEEKFDGMREGISAIRADMAVVKAALRK